MSKHYQLETNLSLSGSNADKRIQIKPSEQGYLISSLHDAVQGKDFDSRLSHIVKALKSNPKNPLLLAIVMIKIYNFL